MRELLAVEWRRTLGKPAWVLGLSVVAGVLAASRQPQAYGFILGIAVGPALTRWIPTPDGEAIDDFLLVRGVATRHGIVVRRLALGLLPAAVALAVVAMLHAVGRGEPRTPLAYLALVALDAHLIGAALVRSIVRRPDSFGLGALAASLSMLPLSVALSLSGTAVISIVSGVVAPLALASLFRAPPDERSTRRQRGSHRAAMLARDVRPPSPPILALARTAAGPALGRDAMATFIVLMTAWAGSLFIGFSAVTAANPGFLSIWLALAGILSLLASMLWMPFAFPSTLVRRPIGRSPLEWILSTPLSRATLATGVSVGTHALLAAATTVGFGGGFALAYALGWPAPRAAVALAFLLLGSHELGMTAFALLQSGRSRRLGARVAIWCAPLALPLVLTLPELERSLRAQNAVLAPWAAETAAPWIAAHVSLALVSLVLASALAQALAYRSFRSYEL